ncbi:hypothetical protein AMTR_s00035p00102410 [Amborella trichopoda]|uniref:Gnk2-homologous domain-containing protein n=1 Tax=Amborella trichopoda TaxID=13333 RepID=W1PW36_AMBTC|nr:hypothetical protein AMTR_s00035p00102410 [Amborella trichopoda]
MRGTRSICGTLSMFLSPICLTVILETSCISYFSDCSLFLFFTTGEIKLSELGEKTMIYGLAQCTNDLSSGDCKACLDKVIGELPTCCSGKQGARVLTGSCNIRYEVYPFYRRSFFFFSHSPSSPLLGQRR